MLNVDKLTYAGNLDSLTSVDDNDRYTFEKADICDAVARQGEGQLQTVCAAVGTGVKDLGL